jgi:alginate O-acetyltransferase complex protein AlgI
MILLGLFTAIGLAPLYWLLVPVRWRREALIAASMVALAAYDARLAALVAAVVLVLHVLVRAIASAPARRAGWLAVLGLGLLAALFTVNKFSGSGLTVLPSQGGLAFLGISYLVLKAAALLIEAARGTVQAVGFRELLSWVVFLPTYPSGPMAEFERFRRQAPTFDTRWALGGLERILFGLVKTLVVAHYLGVWGAPLLAAPEQYSRLALLGGAYAAALRFYFDFSGYSDMAIGLAALYGYDIEENFDRPLWQRNLVQLWQRWHMTLTRFLRLYLFIPISRRLMRPRGPLPDRAAIAVGQIVAMTFCGVWHGLSWNFALWGFAEALGLIWVGSFARDAGARLLPVPFLAWWRRSPLGYTASAALTLTFFSITSIFAMADTAGALRYLRELLGP